MNKGRITAYKELCPSCKQVQDYNDREKYCDWCGHDYGKDWATVEVDLETDLIVRTIVPAQPKQV